MTVNREELHRLVDALPDDQVPEAAEDVRRRLPPAAAGSWPPAWVGAVVAGRSDVARRPDELLADGFGRD